MHTIVHMLTPRDIWRLQLRGIYCFEAYKASTSIILRDNRLLISPEQPHLVSDPDNPS